MPEPRKVDFKPRWMLNLTPEDEAILDAFPGNCPLSPEDLAVPESRKIHIALDMDGVLTDFVGASFKAHGRTFDEATFPPGQYRFEKHLGLSSQDFWAKWQGDASFWAGMPWMHDGQSILYLCCKVAGDSSQVVLATSPSLDPVAAMGKMQWINQHIPKWSRRFLIGAAKHFLANERTILVDDFDDHINAFREHGGKAVLVPRVWNSLHDVARAGETVGYVEHQLKKLAEEILV